MGILGNETALTLLGRALQTGGASQAYLFYGPPGVGKRTVAIRFGAALVAGGDSPAEDRALRGLHPDLTEILPAGAVTTSRVSPPPSSCVLRTGASMLRTGASAPSNRISTVPS